MADQPNKPAGYLPRLATEFYHGDAVVFWTHTIKNRAQGWLTPAFHASFRELMLHVAVRESLLCPIYVLMPDHLHFNSVPARIKNAPPLFFGHDWIGSSLLMRCNTSRTIMCCVTTNAPEEPSPRHAPISQTIPFEHI